MDMGSIWQQAADKWNEVRAQVGDDDLAAPCASCPGWTVGDLIEHAMHWQGQGAMALAGLTPGSPWEELEPALAGALADPANLEGTVEAMGGMPKQQVAGFVIGDLLVHSWDLARSVGADDTLPVEAVQSTYLGLQRVPDQMLRGDNMFGPQIDVGDDPTPQEQLLGFLGRQP
ncbi:MAG: TIGR03086 family metal-binding protein [Actinomycetota bacterium]